MSFKSEWLNHVSKRYLTWFVEKMLIDIHEIKFRLKLPVVNTLNHNHHSSGAMCTKCWSIMPILLLLWLSAGQFTYILYCGSVLVSLPTSFIVAQCWSVYLHPLLWLSAGQFTYILYCGSVLVSLPTSFIVAQCWSVYLYPLGLLLDNNPDEYL